MQEVHVVFVFYLQTHVGEAGILQDGGTLTILQIWKEAGLLPPNKVNEVIENQLLQTDTVLTVVWQDVLILMEELTS